jgi:hypothetical protein
MLNRQIGSEWFAMLHQVIDKHAVVFAFSIVLTAGFAAPCYAQAVDQLDLDQYVVLPITPSTPVIIPGAPVTIPGTPGAPVVVPATQIMPAIVVPIPSDYVFPQYHSADFLPSATTTIAPVRRM